MHTATFMQHRPSHLANIDAYALMTSERLFVLLVTQQPSIFYLKVYKQTNYKTYLCILHLLHQNFYSYVYRILHAGIQSDWSHLHGTAPHPK